MHSLAQSQAYLVETSKQGKTMLAYRDDTLD